MAVTGTQAPAINPDLDYMARQAVLNPGSLDDKWLKLLGATGQISPETTNLAVKMVTRTPGDYGNEISNWVKEAAFKAGSAQAGAGQPAAQAPIVAAQPAGGQAMGRNEMIQQALQLLTQALGGMGSAAPAAPGGDDEFAFLDGISDDKLEKLLAKIEERLA